MRPLLPFCFTLLFTFSFTALFIWARGRNAAAKYGGELKPLPSPALDPRRSCSRRSGQRGAELVEVGFVVVPLFGLTFLLLDVSMTVFLRSTFQHAVREGVRYAITGRNTTGPCQDDSIKAVVQKNAAGFLNNASGAATVHVHFLSPVDSSPTNNGYGNIVEVSVEGYRFGPFAAYQKAATPLQITARAFDMMESVPGPLPCITTAE